jgi:hypothetical protein
MIRSRSASSAWHELHYDPWFTGNVLLQNREQCLGSELAHPTRRAVLDERYQFAPIKIRLGP